MGERWVVRLALLGAIGVAVCLASCSQSDAVRAAGSIHAYLPAVMGLTDDAAAVAETLDPAEAAKFQALAAKVRAELQELEAASGAYVSAPSADGWARLGAVVDALVSDADEGLLAALEIKNPASQAKAEVALSALDAAVHVVDGYLMAVRTPDELKAAAENRAAIQDTEKLEAGKSGAEKPGTETQGAVKLRTVARYWNSKDWERVEQAFGARGEELLGAEMRSGF